VPWSATKLKRAVAELLAHGVWPSVYTEAYPDSRNNPYAVEGVREAFALARKMEPYLLGTETVKSVALHYSRASLDFFGRDDSASYKNSFDGAYRALSQSHIPFDVVMDEQILDGSIAEYDLLVLSNSACTSDRLNETLMDYLDGGGSILATYKTSLYDEYGRKRSDLGLSEAFAVHYVSEAEWAYARATESLAEGLTVSPIIQHRLLRVTTDRDGQVFGTLIDPSPTDLAPFALVSAPTCETSWPMLVKRERVIYCAGDLGYSFMRAGYPDHVRLIDNCVQLLVGDRLPLRIDAPGLVDVALRRQGERVLLHLVNLVTNAADPFGSSGTDAYEVVPVRDLEVWLRLDQPLCRVYQARSNRELEWRHEQGWIVVSVPSLDIYEIVVFELQRNE